jgi:hypothetical protein
MPWIRWRQRGANFQAGVLRGRWGIHEDASIQWPTVVLWIAAADRPKSPARYFLKFNLSQYPAAGPTSHCWDPATKQKLDSAKWPGGREEVDIVFRIDWGTESLYTPYDRVTYERHPADWVTKYPEPKGRPYHSLYQYVNYISGLLNSDLYTGSRDAGNP